MSKFDRNRIKDVWEKLCTNKQTDRHYENNGHLAVNQWIPCYRLKESHSFLRVQSQGLKGRRPPGLPIAGSATVSELLEFVDEKLLFLRFFYWNFVCFFRAFVDVFDRFFLFMVALWNRQTIIFSCCGFCLSFFHRLISSAAHWMSTILPHMVWP